MQPLLAITGILTRASEAKEKTEEAQEKEGLELAVTSSQMEDVNTLEITEEKLSDAIKQQFGNNKDFSVTDNKDGSFLVNMNDTQRMYYIDETGKVISEENMLKISTADELKAFRDDVNGGNTYEGWYVYLANNITLDTNQEWEPIGLYPMENSSPDDETNKPFSGIFDGCQHEINGIYINTTDKVQGLFGLIVNGKISNLGVGGNCNIDGGAATGGVVGYLYDNSQIVNCYSKANVEAPYTMVGGIVGQMAKSCTLRQCFNTATINGSQYVGGICGNLSIDSKVEESYNIGIVKGDSYIGGISGYVQENSMIYMCYNEGMVSGNKTIGGISGGSYRNSSLKSVYNTGNITGQLNNIGGIVGINDNSDLIYDSYNIGNIIGENASQIGSIIGNVQGNNSAKNCYYLENTVNGSNGNTIDGSTPKTSEEFKYLFTKLGKNFKEDTNNINNGYPILQWQ